MVKENRLQRKKREEKREIGNASNRNRNKENNAVMRSSWQDKLEEELKSITHTHQDTELNPDWSNRVVQIHVTDL